MADSGFHAAIAPSQSGISSGATNTLDRAVSGNASGNTTTATVSGFGTSSPNRMPTQVIATRSSRISATAASAGPAPSRHCQPTSSPHTTSVVISRHARTRSAPARPDSSAERAIGSDRNRSTTPRPASTAIADAVAPRP